VLGVFGGVVARHIVGAIANEGKIHSRNIGNIKLFAFHSTIELPKGLSKDLLKNLICTKILNKSINISLLPGFKIYERRINNRTLFKKDKNNHYRYHARRVDQSNISKNTLKSSFFRRKSV
jgi:ATP-dependent RNA helicase DeaD